MKSFSFILVFSCLVSLNLVAAEYRCEGESSQALISIDFTSAGPILMTVEWNNPRDEILFKAELKDFARHKLIDSQNWSELVLEGEYDSFHLRLSTGDYDALSADTYLFSPSFYTTNARGFVYVSPAKIDCKKVN